MVLMNMKTSRSRAALPIPVKRILRKLGEDISVARRKRKISVQLMAERAFIGRNTVTRVENGDPGVSIGIYATILFVLGMSERLGDLIDPAHDRLGLTLEEERLPRRVRRAEARIVTAHGS
jgi:transcriptional regulator with XRE-family HTH domain